MAKTVGGAHRADYSLRSCTQYAMNSDPQREPCCDDHPAWKRSERPLFDHPVETEPDLGAGWGAGDLHMTTDPNGPINHPLHDGAELWLQICLSEGADPVEIAYPSLTDYERQERRECIARMAHRRVAFFAGVDEEIDGLRFAWGVQIAGGDRPDNSRSKQSAAIRT